MLKVGITGGIGSGKTTVCRVFQSLGIRVYNADQEAKFLIDTDARIINEMKSLFGEDIYLNNGILDRKKVGSLVFNNKNLLQKLNEITHPKLIEHSKIWMSAQRDLPYSIKEAAILIESGSYKDMDVVIGVFANKDTRWERVSRRDQMTYEAFEQRLNSQLSDDEIAQYCDFKVNNDNSNYLTQQVLTIHQALIKK